MDKKPFTILKMIHKDCGGTIQEDWTIIYPHSINNGKLIKYTPALRCTRCKQETLGDAQIAFLCEANKTMNVKSGTLAYQEGGEHYKTMSIEPWEIFDAHPQLTHYECSAIKYILRNKPGNDRITELKKAIHHLQHQIELEVAKDETV